MKKQNGFSQIVIMVVMLILAIALPLTANLVKKVQDNRSSAFDFNNPKWNTITAFKTGDKCKAVKGVCGDYDSVPAVGESCSIMSEISNGVIFNGLCDGDASVKCCAPPTSVQGNYPNSCSTSGSNSSKEVGRYSVINNKCYQCQGASSGYYDIQVADSKCGCSSVYCGGCSSPSECSNVGCQWGYWNGSSSPSCINKSQIPTSAPIPVVTNPPAPIVTNPPTSVCTNGSRKCSGNSLQICSSNKWINDPLGNSICVGNHAWNCDNGGAGNGVANNLECQYGCSSSNPGHCNGAPAPVGCGTSGTRRCDGKGTLQICNGTDWISQPVAAICEGTKAYNCDGNITVTNYADCSPLGQVCVNGHCVNPPADCSDAGNYCWNKTYKTGCLGTKLAVHNNCADKANYCAGEYYATAEAKLNKDVTGEICGDPKGCIGTKDCTPVPVNGALGPANGTIVTIKPTSSGACSAGNVTWTDDTATDGTYNWTCAGINGGTSVSGSANKADCTTGSQKCTAINKYFTCSTNGVWSTTTTNCSGSQVCTNGNVGTTVCKDSDYTAPKLNLYFAISGVKKLDSCFGNLNFNVSVTKDGSNIVTSREVTATIVDNKFNDKLGDQVFKISNFDLTNDYALTDKIKITIGSSRKTLTTIYGKDSQNSGFPALNKSQILVSSLVNNVLSLYNYPVLNGDIGTQGSLGTQDKVVNGADFAFMKNEWGKTCKSRENLNADLNGDCRVDTFDLQILKNAMAEQYSQKTD